MLQVGHINFGIMKKERTEEQRQRIGNYIALAVGISIIALVILYEFLKR